MNASYTKTAVWLDVQSAKGAHRLWQRLRNEGHHAAAAIARRMRDADLRAARSKATGGAA